MTSLQIVTDTMLIEEQEKKEENLLKDIEEVKDCYLAINQLLDTHEENLDTIIDNMKKSSNHITDGNNDLIDINKNKKKRNKIILYTSSIVTGTAIGIATGGGSLLLGGLGAVGGSVLGGIGDFVSKQIDKKHDKMIMNYQKLENNEFDEVEDN